MTPACVGHPNQPCFKTKRYPMGIWISSCDDSNCSYLMAMNFSASDSPLPPQTPEHAGTVILALVVGKWGQREGADLAGAGARLQAALLLPAGTRPLQPLGNVSPAQPRNAETGSACACPRPSVRS